MNKSKYRDVYVCNNPGFNFYKNRKRQHPPINAQHGAHRHSSSIARVSLYFFAADLAINISETFVGAQHSNGNSAQEIVFTNLHTK